jgi:hypothetical protein
LICKFEKCVETGFSEMFEDTKCAIRSSNSKNNPMVKTKQEDDNRHNSTKSKEGALKV